MPGPSKALRAARRPAPPNPQSLPQIYIGGPAPQPPQKKYEDWNEMGKDKAFDRSPKLRRA